MVTADLADLPALVGAAKGCEAMVHLGGRSTDGDFIRELLPANVVGTYNAYEAARQADVHRFVFASTVQAEGYPEDSLVTPDMPARPWNMYAVTKVLGESLGRTYARRFGLSVIAIRLGRVAVPRELPALKKAGPEELRWVLTARDCCEMLAHAIEADSGEFELVHGLSLNGATIRDLEYTRKVLGYYPQDTYTND
jgi:uronate dehydrogenase